MKKTTSIVLFLILAGTGSLAAFHEGPHDDGPLERTFKVGKTGEVNIGRDVKIGSHLVRRGKYMLTHRSENHVFVLDEINKKKEPSRLSTLEFDSRFIPHSKRVKNSVLVAKEQQRDHSYELIKIQIAGENGDHLFTTNIGGNNAGASNKN